MPAPRFLRPFGDVDDKGRCSRGRLPRSSERFSIKPQPALVIASEAKQSRAAAIALRSLDCFVASLLAMTIQHGRKRRSFPCSIEFGLPVSEHKSPAPPSLFAPLAPALAAAACLGCAPAPPGAASPAGRADDAHAFYTIIYYVIEQIVYILWKSTVCCDFESGVAMPNTNETAGSASGRSKTVIPANPRFREGRRGDPEL